MYRNTKVLYIVNLMMINFRKGELMMKNKKDHLTKFDMDLKLHDLSDLTIVLFFAAIMITIFKRFLSN